MTSVEDVADTASYAAAGTADTYAAPRWTGLIDVGVRRSACLAALADELHRPVVHFAPAVFRPTFLGMRRVQPSGVGHVVAAKLALLESLQDGWLGPGSIRPTPAAINHYREFLLSMGLMIPLDAEAVATGEGGVRVEWETADGREKVIEFNPDGTAWLFESATDEYALRFSTAGDTTASEESLIDPFDVRTVLAFFIDGVH